MTQDSNSLYSGTDGRMLQNSQSIRIMYDSSDFTGISNSFKQYVIESLLTPVQNIIEAALKVPTANGKLKIGNIDTLCSGTVTVPTVYKKTGVNADLVIFLKARNDPSASYVASATSCLLDITTKRPVMGKITYNLDKVVATTNDAKREKDILVTLHEITHVLGFSNSLYKYYINPLTGKTLSGHYYTKTIMGFPTTVLNLPSLTTRLRNHFNCSTLEGAYLENQGGSQSAGSHFERRILYNDYMTASAIIDTRLTEFTLALLEGTGWYTVNYDMADPITWGKNEGCSFVQGDCMNKNTKRPNFKEFCSPLSASSCSWTKRAGGTCGAFQLQKDSSLPSAIDWWGDKTATQDTFSDNCPIVLAYNNIDCEDTDNQGGSTLSSEFYGYGSKCFMGTLYPTGSLNSLYPLCFKPTCRGNSKSGYYVEVKIGGQSVNCYSQGLIGVPGYGGVLSCPNPSDFCGQIMSEGFCRRGCSGRGTCVDRECVCNDGWGGFDCSKPTYEDHCTRCVNGDPLKTSCFGDTCGCNPTNSTCMCPDGTPNITDCVQSVVDYINSLNRDNNGPSTTISLDTTDSKHGISSQALIAIICGSVGGVLVILGVFFGIRYAKKAARKKKVTRTPRSRLPKLELQIENVFTADLAGQNPNSAQYSSKTLSLRSHNDSPLIAQNNSYKGKTMTPSLFKRSTSKIHPELGSTPEHDAHITPDPESKLPDIEDPPMAHVTEFEIDSPKVNIPLPFEPKSADAALKV